MPEAKGLARRGRQPAISQYTRNFFTGASLVERLVESVVLGGCVMLTIPF